MKLASGKIARGGQKSGEAGLGFHIRGQTRQGEARACTMSAGQRVQERRGKERKRDGRGDGIAGKAEEPLHGAGLLVCSLAGAGPLTKDGWLAGLDAHAGEVKAGAGAGESRLDEIEFARRNAAGDEEQIGLGGLSERRVQGFGCVTRYGQNPRLATGRGHHRGQHGSVRIANLSGTWPRPDGHKLVSGSENGHTRANEDLELCAAAGGHERYLRRAYRGSRGQQFGTLARLRAAGHDVFTLLYGARRQQPDGSRCGPAAGLDVLQHHHGIGAGRDGRAGHDLPCRAGHQWTGWSLPGTG